MITKKLIIVAAIAAVGLTACGNTPHDEQKGPSTATEYDVSVISTAHWVILPGGHTRVLCVYESREGSSGGGPSCNWNDIHLVP